MIIDSESRNSSTVINMDVASPFTYPPPFTGTNITDLGNFKNNGVASNCGYISSNGGGLTYNGSTSVVTIANNASLDIQSYTFEAWIKLSSLGARRVILCSSQTGGSSMDHAFWLEVNASNKLQTFFGNVSGTGNVLNVSIASITTNITHVSCIRNNTNQTIEFIINGVSDGIRAWAKTGIVTSTTKSIGSYNVQIGRSSISGSPTPFSGNIYKWSLTNTALTAEQVTASFNQNKNRFGF